MTVDYSWVDTERDLALTVAVARGVRAKQVVRAYGGDPDDRSLGSGRFEDSAVPSYEFGEYCLARVIDGPGFSTAVENNGGSGNVPEIARRVTRDGGRFFSVHWRANGLASITEAEDGVVTAYFQPMFADLGPGVGDVHPDWLDPQAFDVVRNRSASFAIMEERIGLCVDRYWLTLRLPMYRIPNPDVMLRDVPGARLP